MRSSVCLRLIPASTRIEVDPVEMYVQLPLLPLPSTQTFITVIHR
jgi:hypothetical protein